MKIVLEMVGCKCIRSDIMQNLIEEIVVNETGSFADKKVVVLSYDEKRGTVRGDECTAAVQSRWNARKMWRKLREENQTINLRSPKRI